MNVVMTFNGGPMDGTYEFEDNGDIMSLVRQTQDSGLQMAITTYVMSRGGRVGRGVQGVTPGMLDQLRREGFTEGMNSPGMNYQIISRKNDEATNTVAIIAKFVPRK